MKVKHFRDGLSMIIMIGLTFFGLNNNVKAIENQVYNYGYTGGVQEFTAMYTGDYKLEVWGAQGGYRTTAGKAGNGGYATGIVRLNRGEKIYIYVGGRGGNGSNGCGKTICPGGWNGGGYRYKYYGGGGATDIRLVNGSWNNANSLKSRLIVAGGGGSDGAASKQGMYGGGTTGGSSTENYSGVGNYGGKGGTQTYSGYSTAYTIANQTTSGLNTNATANYAGGFGFGGGGVFLSNGYGGAGGGGWYGGSGNVPDGSGDDDRGGGGGSGFIWTASTAGSVPSGYSVPTSKYLTEARLVAGNASMPNTAGTGNMTGNAGNGYARITVLVSEMLTASGLELIPGTTDYDLDVTIPSSTYKTTIGYTHEGIIWTSGTGEVTLQNGVNHRVVLMYSNGTIKVYNINPVTAKARLANIAITGQNFGFNSTIYDYSLSVANEATSLSITVTPESGVTYTIEGNNLIVGDNLVKVIASKPGAESTVYNFHVNRAFKSIATTVTKTYSYTGNYQSFTAPYTTDYKLEVWGAQGGYRTTAANGGYGGYSRGTVRLTAGTTIYIYVGARPGTGANGCGSTICAGGWNGGGYRYKYYGGGGATDIRLTSGAWNNANSLKSRIIVAGGGGSDGATGKPGGAGGGTTGISRSESYTAISDSCGIGGNQTYSGKSTATTISSQTTTGLASNTLANYGGGFGFGGGGTFLSAGYGGAGGGGWYGGTGVIPDGSVDDDRGGGGGSGFVWTSANASKVPSGYTPSTAYYLSNTAVTAGNAAMPNWAGTANMTGNANHGYAKITYANQIDMDELTSITVDKGTLSPAFNKDTLEYTLNLGMEDTSLTINATTSKGLANVVGKGTFDIPAGTKTFNLTVTNLDGVATVYKINVTRLANPSSIIDGFKVNGTPFEGFDPAVFDYTIEVPLVTPKVNLEIIKKYPGQTYTPTNTIFDLPGSTRTETILVTSEGNASNQPYTFTFNRELSSKLKSLTIGGGTIEGGFDPNKTNYTLRLDENTRELEVVAEAWFTDAVITKTEPRYVGISDTTLTVRVDLNGTDPTIYTFNIVRNNNPPQNVINNFGYTGNYQTYTAPYTGNYKLEVWGAQGGYRSTAANGGKGGYAAGTVSLNAGQVLYIYVGGRGGNGTSGCGSTICAGGWNGGGYRNKYYGGGGATDIRLTAGTWDNAASLKSRLIVAGGGGSDGATGKAGGAGGGTTGASRTESYTAISNYGGKGGTQTYSGYSAAYTITSQGRSALNANNKNYYAGGFGFGGGGVFLSNGYGGAGGGGWYGGSGNVPDGSADDDRGGGGGSGFVWTNSTKGNVPSGYSVGTQFYLTATKLVAGTASMPNYAGTGTMTGNSGNGYAKITAIASEQRDAFLDSISLTTVGGTNIPVNNFETWTTRYEITVPSDTYKLNIGAVPKDTKATIEGTGLINITSGTHEYNVVVTNGATVKTYTLVITRDPSSDPSPENIELRNPLAHLCGYDTERLCIYSYNPETTAYDIVLPFQSTTITFKTTLRSPEQRVKYYSVTTTTNEEGDEVDVRTEISSTNGEITINLGDTISIYEVEVTPEDGSAPRVYTYNLERDLRGNNNLDRLTVDAPASDTPFINFQPSVFEYAFSIPATAPGEDDSFTISYKPQNSEATVRIASTLSFDTTTSDGVYTSTTHMTSSGMKDVYVVVTSPNGNSKTYILHVYKEKNTNTFLGSLTLTDEKDVDVTASLSPTFSKFITNYTLEVPNTTQTITVNATPEVVSENPLIIKGNGNPIGNSPLTLNSGVNNIEILVTSESGDAEIYTISVVKAKNNNSRLTNIVVEEYREEGKEVVTYGLTPIFNGDEYSYELDREIAKSITRLNVIATPEVDTTTYTVRGNNTLNKKSNTIVITALAEDKTFTTYEIVVNKNVQTDNYLENIIITTTDSNGNTIPLTLNEEFRKEDLNYTLNVESTVSVISLTGVLDASKNSTVSGGGIHSLAKGNNTLPLIVTSEAGEPRTYTITINRATDSNTNLLRVRNNQGSTVSSAPEGETAYDYLINVQYEVNAIEIVGEVESVTSRVTGNGIKNLSVGNNDYILTVTAESGATANYKVRVVRDLSNNDDLKFLYVQEGGLSPRFKETTISYDVKVPNNIDNLNKLHIEAITEDPNATVELLHASSPIGDTPLTVGEAKEVIVKVTAQDRINTKEYKIEIIRQEPIPANENLALASLTTNRGELVPTFNANTLNYTLTVENDITNITISATPMDTDANLVIDGTGTYNLVEGKNGFTVFVIGESGVQQDYQIVVTRKASSDASLASLVVKGKVLSPKFSSDVLNYSVVTSAEYLEFTAIKPTHPNATYTVTGNEGITSGNNKDILITVTAADGETTRVYTITASGEPSTNNNLASLSVEGYTITPVFHKGVTFYAVEVANNVNSIAIAATPEDEGATVEGIGLKPIDSGENYFQVIVRSAAGTEKTYTVLVTKEASNNNFLSSLDVSEGEYAPIFNKETPSYTMTVPYDVDNITITATPEDANAFVIGTGTHALVEGDNTIILTVTAESGDTKTYTMVITREPVVSAYLSSLSVPGHSLDRTFNKEVLDYYITVPSDVTSLTPVYTTEERGATVEVLNNSDFTLGMNTVSIVVTSATDPNVTNTYKIYVNRQMSTNNYLSVLYTSEGDISPEFEQNTLEYRITVPRETESIEIFATAEDELSTITEGLGTHELELGENTINVKVKSSIGITRTYRVIVTRLKSSNNYLSLLSLSSLTSDIPFETAFNKETLEYNVTVGSDVSYVVVDAIPEDENAEITGDGIKELRSGDNTISVVVKAEDNTERTYVINISKNVSTNNYLSSIIPSVGEFEEEWDRERTEYTLNLAYEVNDLAFTVTKESELATVTGTELQIVSDGESYRNITVTAEDGSTRVYRIKVIKESASEAKLEILHVNGYAIDFNPDTFTYNISVSRSKDVLREDEITAVAKDEEATVNLMGDLTLIKNGMSIYVIEVIARDGYTTQEYRINITRDNDELTLRLTTDFYTIVRKDDTELEDQGFILTDDDYVIGIRSATDLTTFLNNFDNNPEYLRVYNLESDQLENDEDRVGTGMVVNLEKDNYIYDSLVIVVRGDLSKDGSVDGRDQSKFLSYITKSTTLDTYQTIAADLTKDGSVDGRDQSKFLRYIVKSISDVND